MLEFIYTLVANIFISLGIILIIFSLSRLKNFLVNISNYLTALTVGLILGIVFLGFLPKLQGKISEVLSFFIVLGIVLFFLFEIFLHWHHCKELGNTCEDKLHHNEHKNLLMINISTFLHNFIHGIVIFSAFSVSVTLGIATSFSIFLHSIPQNIANFLLSLNNLRLVYIAAIANVFGALILFPFKDFILNYKIYFIAFIMGGLIYIAMTDILPEFKMYGKIINKFIYFGLVVIGVVLFYLIHLFI